VRQLAPQFMRALYFKEIYVHNFKLAVAQVSSIKGNIDANIAVHLNAIEKASDLGVAYIVFPELSITGYESELALELAFSKEDTRLQPLIDSAIKNNIKIGVGAPLLSDGLPKIGLIIISPSGIVETYAKMHLHPGEDEYFSEGGHHHYVIINDTTIANAICADTNNPKHANYCFEFGASVYIAGVMITEGGYDADTIAMKNLAKKYNMLVAMANHNQPTGGWAPVGKSAIWSSSGLLAKASETQNTLVVATKLNNEWSAQAIEI
jgi:predicted amidohydrolase